MAFGMPAASLGSSDENSMTMIDLAGDALLVQHRAIVLGVGVRTGEDGFARLDQQPRLGLVRRRHLPGDGEGQPGDDERHHDDSQPVPREAREKLSQIDIDVGGRGLNGHRFPTPDTGQAWTVKDYGNSAVKTSVTVC
jgi:hypothetical protein